MSRNYYFSLCGKILFLVAFFTINIFKDNMREDRIMNPHVPIIQLTLVISFAIFISVLPSTWVRVMEYFKTMIIFISGTHFLIIKLQ